jgi:hypothetical protein
MKTMKTCKMGCGKMKAGGAVKKIRKMQPGGQANAALLSAINRKGVPMSGSTGTNNSQSNIIMKKGGTKKYQPGGPVYEGASQRVPTKSTTPNKFNTPVGTGTFVKSGGAIKSSYKKGGATKNAKLAAMAAPKNKITRADIITAVTKKKKSKKK